MNRILAKITARPIVAAGALAVAALAMLPGLAQAQSLTVLPVSIEMAPGQLATTLTVINQGKSPTSIQVRALGWGQPQGKDTLTPSDLVVASPPIATIAPGATQTIRLVLRQAAVGHEATYRILLDQIPSPADPGTVRIALRLSVPVFAQPATRVTPDVQYRVDQDAGQYYLIAANDGGRHNRLRGLVLKTGAGKDLATTVTASPYILAGATRRWKIDTSSQTLKSGDTLSLTGSTDTGAVDQKVAVSAHP